MTSRSRSSSTCRASRSASASEPSGPYESRCNSSLRGPADRPFRGQAPPSGRDGLRRLRARAGCVRRGILAAARRAARAGGEQRRRRQRPGRNRGPARARLAGRAGHGPVRQPRPAGRGRVRSGRWRRSGSTGNGTDRPGRHRANRVDTRHHGRTAHRAGGAARHRARAVHRHGEPGPARDVRARGRRRAGEHRRLDARGAARGAGHGRVRQPRERRGGAVVCRERGRLGHPGQQCHGRNGRGLHIADARPDARTEPRARARGRPSGRGVRSHGAGPAEPEHRRRVPGAEHAGPRRPRAAGGRKGCAAARLRRRYAAERAAARRPHRPLPGRHPHREPHAPRTGRRRAHRSGRGLARPVVEPGHPRRHGRARARLPRHGRSGRRDRGDRRERQHVPGIRHTARAGREDAAPVRHSLRPRPHRGRDHGDRQRDRGERGELPGRCPEGLPAPRRQRGRARTVHEQREHDQHRGGLEHDHQRGPGAAHHGGQPELLLRRAGQGGRVALLRARLRPLPGRDRAGPVRLVDGRARVGAQLRPAARAVRQPGQSGSQLSVPERLDRRARLRSRDRPAQAAIDARGPDVLLLAGVDQRLHVPRRARVP